MSRRGLSKSRILSFLQCPKRAYLEVHRPELLEVSAETERKFQAGHEVGETARRLNPGGILIGNDRGLAQALRDTREALAESPDRPLYEATFEHDGVLVRADLLLPAERGRRLVEVKASTKPKDCHFADCAVQAWVLRQAGCALECVELAYVDKLFIYPGNGDYRGLLFQVDVAAAIEEQQNEVPRWIAEYRRTLAGEEPRIEPGDQCTNPYPCPLQGHCIPPPQGYPVTLLPGSKKIARAFEAAGITDIRDIPPGRLTNATHERIRHATTSGRPGFDPAAAEELHHLPWPRYYLDFETVQFAVPIWPGTRPYQNLPFQWSCHIETEKGELLHREFLDVSGQAPMRALAESLIETMNLEDKGPVFAYFQGFERRCLNDLAEMFPELSDELYGISERLVDLLPVTQRAYYHPEMRGSWSLKAVLPTIAPDLDYARLDEVQDGGSAQAAYLEIIHPQTTPKRRERLVQALRDYCRTDTLGLVRLAEFLTDGDAS